MAVIAGEPAGQGRPRESADGYHAHGQGEVRPAPCQGDGRGDEGEARHPAEPGGGPLHQTGDQEQPVRAADGEQQADRGQAQERGEQRSAGASAVDEPSGEGRDRDHHGRVRGEQQSGRRRSEALDCGHEGEERYEHAVDEHVGEQSGAGDDDRHARTGPARYGCWDGRGHECSSVGVGRGRRPSGSESARFRRRRSRWPSGLPSFPGGEPRRISQGR